MRNTIYISVICALLLNMVGCTSNFDSENTDPYGVTEEQAAIDFVNIGGYLTTMQKYIYNVTTGLQTEQNLTGDAFAQYMVPPTPFQSNRNNVTYNFVWYSQQWDITYSNEMSNLSLLVNKYNADTEYPNFYAWGQVLKIFAMQRVTDNYGPIIYSDYGAESAPYTYDSQKDVYYAFFNELDAAIDTLTTYADAGSTAFEKFDAAYGGDVAEWVKAANSLRLRLAMRLANVDPTKAQEEAEAAVSQKYGVMESNDDNFMVALGSSVHPLWYFSDSWQDCRMCATVESIMGGYSDPRLPMYFATATDADLADGTYKGIRQGIAIDSKSTYQNFSGVSSTITGSTTAQVMVAAEVSFLRAEGALRGWNMGDLTAEEYYNQGIQQSFEQYGLSSYSTYETDNTSKFADYVDPKNSTNSFSASSDITIKWDATDTNERNLERIITQKWIALFPDGQEAWSEFRRTGYPKLLPVVVNYSSGKISTADFVRRTPYPDAEYTSDAEGVAGGVTLLGGADTGGTRVWWDTGTGSNF